VVVPSIFSLASPPTLKMPVMNYLTKCGVALSGVGTSWGFWISTINGDPISNLMTALNLDT
jgi:hypothetical protein